MGIEGKAVQNCASGAILPAGVSPALLIVFESHIQTRDNNGTKCGPDFILLRCCAETGPLAQ